MERDSTIERSCLSALPDNEIRISLGVIEVLVALTAFLLLLQTFALITVRFVQRVFSMNGKIHRGFCVPTNWRARARRLSTFCRSTSFRSWTRFSTPAKNCPRLTTLAQSSITIESCSRLSLMDSAERRSSSWRHCSGSPQERGLGRNFKTIGTSNLPVFDSSTALV